MRDIVRGEFPLASATDIEKLVGQRWSQLTAEGKARYGELAARARRGAGPALTAPPPGRVSQASGSLRRTGEGSPRRTHSDAASPRAASVALAASRQPRRHRPPARFSWEDEGGGALAGAFAEEAEAAAAEAEEAAAQATGLVGAAAPKSEVAADVALMYQGVRRHAELAARAVAKRPLCPGLEAGGAEAGGRKRGREAGVRSEVGGTEDEQDVLGLLESMQAEAIASGSDGEAGDHDSQAQAGSGVVGGECLLKPFEAQPAEGADL